MSFLSCHSIESLCLKNEKPIAKQIEIETKIEKEIENKNNIFLKILLDSESWIEVTSMQSQKKFNKIQVAKKLNEFVNVCNAKFDFKSSKKEMANHFISWLNLQDNPENGRF